MNRRAMNRRTTVKNIASFGLSIATAISLGSISACSEQKPQFKAIDVTGADYAKDFALTDHNGQARTMADFKGKVVVIFFGYTQCPDVCPTSMTELAEVKKLLGADGDKLQGLFVTVDPERDTAALLKAYMVNFDPSFLALRGEPDKLEAAAKHFKIYYRKAEGKTPTSYTMDHSAGSYVYDTQGRVRLFTRYGSGAAALASDIKLLLAAKG
jgi:protein SCO1/2